MPSSACKKRDSHETDRHPDGRRRHPSPELVAVRRRQAGRPRQLQGGRLRQALFFFLHPARTELYSLSLHDALPICFEAAVQVDRRDERFEGIGEQRVLLGPPALPFRSEEHTSELQSRLHLVCRLLPAKKEIPMKRIGILTAGADTPALNSSLYGAVRLGDLGNFKVVGFVKRFFFFCIPRVPSSTLFPYTTLFRSASKPPSKWIAAMSASKASASKESFSAPPLFLSDRKSTRLNSSHGYISYAVFCLQKKRFP